MKNFFKARFADMLAYCAREVVRKYKPKIIMVTGSVGKTSTKDALGAALGTRYYLRASEKSYNSEFGVPLTVFGSKNPWHDLVAWANVLKGALALLLLPNHYPNLLVLEVGADRPGDLEKILRIAAPDAVVVTRLPDIPVHVEAYATPQAVREEEFSPAYHLAPEAPLIISADDPHAREMAARVAAHVVTYGVAPDADVRISQIDFYTEGDVTVGMQAQITTKEDAGVMVVRGSVGTTQVLPVAAALATAIAFGASLPETLDALASYEPPPGRGRVFRGVNGTMIIDDSYNASPAAVEEALATLQRFPGKGRKIAVLGDMLELGRYSVAEHERIGTLAAGAADIVISVGIRARGLAESARVAKQGCSCAFSYDSAAEAAQALPAYIEQGDIILIKGSQSVRTERIVEALLADRHDLSRLVRQEHEWKKR